MFKLNTSNHWLWLIKMTAARKGPFIEYSESSQTAKLMQILCRSSRNPMYVHCDQDLPNHCIQPITGKSRCVYIYGKRSGSFQKAIHRAAWDQLPSGWSSYDTCLWTPLNSDEQNICVCFCENWHTDHYHPSPGPIPIAVGNIPHCGHNLYFIR